MENPRLIRAAWRNEKAKCDEFHCTQPGNPARPHTPLRQSVPPNTEEQQRQVKEAAQGLTQHLSAFPASEAASCGPADLRHPAHPARPALGFVWPGWTPSLPILLHTHHSPRSSCGGFSPFRPLPSQAPALFKRGFSYQARD